MFVPGAYTSDLFLLRLSRLTRRFEDGATEKGGYEEWDGWSESGAAGVWGGGARRKAGASGLGREGVLNPGHLKPRSPWFVPGGTG